MLIVLVLAAVLATASAILVWLAFSTVETKMTGKSSLKAIENYTWQGDDLVGKEESLFDRVILPVNKSLLGLARKFTPIGYVDSARTKLIIAGRRGPDELDRFMAIRALSLVLVPVMWVLVGFVLPVEGKVKWLTLALLTAVLVFGPDAKLTSAKQDRQKQIRRALPDTMDLLTISVEAGLGFEQAIDRITASVDGPLSMEFNRMIGEMRAGSGRSEALMALDARTDVEEMKTFVLAMVQADQFGVSIGRVLRAQADEMRIKRRQLAQEAAQKAPVKMLLPMTFCIFPALFIVLLGPAALSIVTTL